MSTLPPPPEQPAAPTTPEGMGVAPSGEVPATAPGYAAPVGDVAAPAYSAAPVAPGYGAPAAPAAPAYGAPAAPAYGATPTVAPAYGIPAAQPGVSQVPHPDYGQPYAQQPQAPGYAPYAPAAAGTNVLAIISLVSSFFVGVAGVVCGFIALGQIKRTGESGRGLAIAGICVGFAAIAVVVLYIVFAIIVSLASAATYGSYRY